MKIRPAAMFVAGLFAVPSFKARADDFVEGEVLVTFKPHLMAGAATDALGRHSLAMDRQYRRIAAKRQRVCGLVRGKGQLTARLIERLKTDAAVDTVEPNYIRRIATVMPNDPDFTRLWGLRNIGQSVNGVAGATGADIGFPAAWKMARTEGPEVVVGVVDTGVDIVHPDLAPNIWVNTMEIPGNGVDDDRNGFRDDVNGYDFASHSGAVTDSGVHGTHVAGTIAAVGKNGTGVIGVQYRAKILPLQVSDDGESMPTSAVLDAYDYAVMLKERGVNIVALNASFGGTSRSSAEQIAVQALHDAGIVLCVAAGNEGSNNDAIPSYPASYPVPNVISVAALTPGNRLAGFSNYGAASVDLAAPGVNIYSTIPLAEVRMTGGVKLGTASYEAVGLAYSGSTAATGVTGTVHYCGVGSREDFPAAVTGNIALIRRGTLTFAQKVSNAMAAGAAAVILYDNTPEGLTGDWALGSGITWVPTLQVTMATGEALVSKLPATATVTAWRDTDLAYQFEDGTSMAAPHVSGAVAFAALNFPAETISQRIARILNHVTPVTVLAGRVATGGRLNLPGIVDTDNDGLPDWWEAERLGSLAATTIGDPDKDGFSNADEFLALTDPASAGSHLAFSSISDFTDSTGRHIALEFSAAPDRTYQVEWSPGMQPNSWMPLGGPITGGGATVRIVDAEAFAPARPSRFYRLRAVGE